MLSIFFRKKWLPNENPRNRREVYVFSLYIFYQESKCIKLRHRIFFVDPEAVWWPNTGYTEVYKDHCRGLTLNKFLHDYIYLFKKITWFSTCNRHTGTLKVKQGFALLSAIQQKS